MTVQKSTYQCNSAVKNPVEYKKTVEYNLGKKEEKRQFFIPAKKFQSKHSGIHPRAEKRWNPTKSRSIT